MVSHAVVVLCLRYLLEGLTEAQILEIDRAAEVGYCAVTSYSVDATAGGSGRLRLRRFNWVPSAVPRQGVG